MVGQVDGFFSGFEKELPRNLDSVQVFGRVVEDQEGALLSIARCFWFRIRGAVNGRLLGSLFIELFGE